MLIAVGNGCTGITSAFTNANLISAVTNTANGYPNTKSYFGQPVKCALGYTWSDGTSYSIPKSVICYFASATNKTWYLPNCTGE